MITLSETETKMQIAAISPKWSFDGKDLLREFIFDSYLNSIEFVNAIGLVAEAMNHHPVIHISWGKVLVQIHTHSLGEIGPLDFEFASRLDIFYLLHCDL